MRTILILGFAVGAVTLGLACSDSSSNNNASSSGSSGTTSGGTSGSTGSSGSFSTCQGQAGGTSGTGESKCTDAELKTYNDCVLAKCDAKYKECYGPDYKSGKLSGACGTWVTCTQKCPCTDAQCMMNCPMDDACTSCAVGAGSCANACPLPECAKTSTPPPSGDSGTSAGTCADLKACCDKMAAGQLKDSCNQAHDSASGNDATCGQVYSGLKSFCP